MFFKNLNIIILMTSIFLTTICCAKKSAGLTDILEGFPNNTRSIYVKYGNIPVIPSDTFIYFSRCINLILEHNNINTINVNAFRGLTNLQNLKLSYNPLGNIADRIFCHLKKLKNLELSNTGIRHLPSSWFTCLKSLQQIQLDRNNISEIKPGSFEQLQNLKTIDLNSNNLEYIESGTFADLHKLCEINLSHNRIHTVESGAFAFISDIKNCVQNNSAGIINLTYSGITFIGWDVFILNKSNLTKVRKILGKKMILLDITWKSLPCGNNSCWMIRGDRKRWIRSYTNSWLFKCGKSDCPTNGMCVDNPIKCRNACQRHGYGKNYYKARIDGKYCPFQYFCDCNCINIDLCKDQCKKVGKVPVEGEPNKVGCRRCDCECAKTNCVQKCLGYRFKVINNTSGCPQCDCICLNTECDVKCGGIGLGIMGPKDERGCVTCVGCEKQGVQEKQISEGGSQNVAIITVSTIAGVCLLCISIALPVGVYMRKGMKHKTEKLGPELTKQKETELEVLIKHLDPDLVEQVKKCWIPKYSLRVENLIGRGIFGIVWSGKLQRHQESEIDVAIKKIRGEYKDGWKTENKLTKDDKLKAEFIKVRLEIELDKDLVQQFIHEATIMRNFDHPNVLSMIGISVHNDKPCVVLPLMRNGDLRSYLKKHSSRLTNPELLSFALGAVKGMQHLVEQNFVHRDLAARNCMLDENLVLKISDFGLTKDVIGKEYYRAEDKSVPLPIRWMSIEAIQQSIFTTQGDVWSYGVLLWEIFSYGAQPYQGISNTEIGKYLSEGNRLEQPQLAPDTMYDLMLQCWKSDPEERPSFAAILTLLNDFGDIEANYLEVDDTECVAINKTQDLKQNTEQNMKISPDVHVEEEKKKN